MLLMAAPSVGGFRHRAMSKTWHRQIRTLHLRANADVMHARQTKFASQEAGNSEIVKIAAGQTDNDRDESYFVARREHAVLIVTLTQNLMQQSKFTRSGIWHFGRSMEARADLQKLMNFDAVVWVESLGSSSAMTHHDRDESANNRQRCGLSQNQLGQHNTEDRLQRLHSVGQADGHSSKGQVGGHVSNGMHGSWPSDLAELFLGDTLQTT